MPVFKYQVKKGDTLPSLSSKYRTPVSQILKQNGGITSLSPGAVISLPTSPNPNFKTTPIKPVFPINPNYQTSGVNFNVNPPGIGEQYAGSSNYVGAASNQLAPSTTTQAQGSFVGGSGQVNTGAVGNNQSQDVPEFPGFFGGGKNGQFYATLREARIATRRLNMAKGWTPVEKQAVTDMASQALTWRVGG